MKPMAPPAAPALSDATVDVADDRMRLRVLQVFLEADRRHLGGVHSYLKLLKLALDGTQVDSEFAAIGPCDELDWLSPVAYAGRRNDSRLEARYRFLRWCSPALRRYDLVHIHLSSWPLLVAAPGCLRQGIPFVVSPHGMLEPWQSRNLGMFWRLGGLRMAQGLLQKCNALIGTTDKERSHWEALGVRPKGYVAPPALDPDDHVVRGGSSAVDVAGLRLLFVGHLVPVKNLPLLIDAVAQLRKAGIALELRIVGDTGTKHGKELLRQVQVHDLGEVVHFLGALSAAERRREMERAQVFVLPSHAENFSFATAEAMAAGLPVIVTESVALAGSVHQWNCGQVIAPDNLEQLVRAIASYTHATLRDRHGSNGRSLARREFTHAAMRKGLLTAYDYALGGRLALISAPSAIE